LVVVGESTVEEAIEKAGLKAEKQVAKELNVKPKDIDDAIRDAAGELS
jgi:lambda repressor-like predicted transcriptional regulator